MNILVTGGTGLIGSHLINEMVAEGHHFTVLTRSPESASRSLPASCKFVKALAEAADFSYFDAVINLAGEPIADKRWSALQKRRICDSRWNITSQLVARINAASSPPQVVISGSAVGFYGRQGDRQVTEHNYFVNDEFTHQVCAKWEDIALSAQSDKTRVCVLRTGIVLDSEKGALAKMRLPFKLGLGGKLGSGEQYMSWIHIKDMVAGIRFLLTHYHCQGAFNFTAPEPVTNKTFTDEFARSMNRPSLFTVPAFSLKLLLGEASDLLLTGQNVYPARLTEAGFTFSYPEIRQAMQAL